MGNDNTRIYNNARALIPKDWSQLHEVYDNSRKIGKEHCKKKNNQRSPVPIRVQQDQRYWLQLLKQ